MHSISSKYRKPKGRPTKRRKAGSANILKRKSSEMQLNDVSIPNINPETVPGTSVDTDNHCNSLSAMSTEYCLISNSVWADLLQNVPCSECRQWI